MIEDMIMEAGRETPDNIGELLTTARAEWIETQKTTDLLIMALVKSLDLMKERHTESWVIQINRHLKSSPLFFRLIQSKNLSRYLSQF